MQSFTQISGLECENVFCKFAITELYFDVAKEKKFKMKHDSTGKTIVLINVVLIQIFASLAVAKDLKSSILLNMPVGIPIASNFDPDLKKEKKPFLDAIGKNISKFAKVNCKGVEYIPVGLDMKVLPRITNLIEGRYKVVEVERSENLRDYKDMGMFLDVYKYYRIYSKLSKSPILAMKIDISYISVGSRVTKADLVKQEPSGGLLSICKL